MALLLTTTTELVNFSGSCRVGSSRKIWTRVQLCFAALRQIRSVRRSLSRHALLTLVRALIVSKVDYCNSVLAGISGQLQDRWRGRLECRRPFGFLGEAVRTHNPTAS